MAKLNRVCFTCGKKHSYCPDCYEDRHLETWHIMFHDKNCKNIYDIINSHFYKHLTTEKAINELEKCDLTNIESFNEDMKKDIKYILAQKKIEINIKPTEEPVVIMNNKNSYKNKK